MEPTGPLIASLPADQLPPVLDAMQAAQIQRCSQKTTEEMLRDGLLPGVKWGEGWAIPTRAFLDRLNELATQSMQKRHEERNGSRPQFVAANPRGGRRREPPDLGLVRVRPVS